MDIKIDQPVVFKTMKSIVEKRNSNHAFLFNTNGNQNEKDIIMTFVKGLLCRNHAAGENCEVCHRIDENNYPELIIVNEKRSTIKKDSLSALKKNFSKKSLEGDLRVYVIYDVDKLTDESSNSMLKFLEEPEENIIAILVTDKINKVMGTIKSRCQIINLKRNESLTIEESSVSKIKKVIFKDDNNNVDTDKLEKTIEKILDFVVFLYKDKKYVLTRSKEIWHNHFKDRDSVAEGLDIMIFLYRDLLNYKISGNFKVFNDYEIRLKKIAESSEIVDLISKIDKILIMKAKAASNMNQNLLFDKLVIELGSERR